MSMCVANSYSINKNKMAALNSPKHTQPANLLKTDDVNTHVHTHAGECIHSEKSEGLKYNTFQYVVYFICLIDLS